jgi:hypothetical protein
MRYPPNWNRKRDVNANGPGPGASIGVFALLFVKFIVNRKNRQAKMRGSLLRCFADQDYIGVNVTAKESELLSIGRPSETDDLI